MFGILKNLLTALVLLASLAGFLALLSGGDSRLFVAMVATVLIGFPIMGLALMCAPHSSDY